MTATPPDDEITLRACHAFLAGLLGFVFGLLGSGVLGLDNGWIGVVSGAIAVAAGITAYTFGSGFWKLMLVASVLPLAIFMRPSPFEVMRDVVEQQRRRRRNRTDRTHDSKIA